MSVISLVRKLLSAQWSYRSRKKCSVRTKVKRKGLFTRLLKLFKPFVNFIDKVGLRFIFDFAVIQFIRGYQKYLSPHKGFSCAYSRRHGAESCSEYFRQKVRTHGLAKAIPLFEQRLRDCKLAHITMKGQSQSKEKD